MQVGKDGSSLLAEAEAGAEAVLYNVFVHMPTWEPDAGTSDTLSATPTAWEPVSWRDFASAMLRTLLHRARIVLRRSPVFSPILQHHLDSTASWPLAVSSDGAKVAVLTDTGVEVRHAASAFGLALATWTKPSSLSGPWIGAQWSQDGCILLAVASNGRCFALDGADLSLIHDIPASVVSAAPRERIVAGIGVRTAVCTRVRGHSVAELVVVTFGGKVHRQHVPATSTRPPHPTPAKRRGIRASARVTGPDTSDERHADDSDDDDEAEQQQQQQQHRRRVSNASSALASGASPCEQAASVSVRAHHGRVACAVLHAATSLLAIGGGPPSPNGDDDDADTRTASISLWRLNDEGPGSAGMHLVYATHTVAVSGRPRLARFIEHPLMLSLAFDAAGSMLASADSSGTVSVWDTDTLALLHRWDSARLLVNSPAPAPAPVAATATATVTQSASVASATGGVASRGTAEDGGDESSTDISNLAGSADDAAAVDIVPGSADRRVCSVAWWSESALVVAAYDGALAVVSIHTGEDLLSDPAVFLPGPRVTNALNGRMLLLECQRVWARVRGGRRRRRSQSSAVARIFGTPDDDGFLYERSLPLGLGWLHELADSATSSSSSQWHPLYSLRSQRVQQRVFRLVSMLKTTPDELFRAKVSLGEYAEALRVAERFALDTDLVYQQQWSEAAVSGESINEFLDKVQDRAWVRREVETRIASTFSAQRALLQFGLSHCSREDVLRAGLAPGQDLPYQDAAADPDAALGVPLRAEDLNAQQIDLCIHRTRLLRYLDRLETLSLISSGVADEPSDDTLNAAAFRRFRSCDVLEAAVYYAEHVNTHALSVLLRYHSDDVLPGRLTVLRRFPCTTPVELYAHLLPGLDADTGLEASWPREQHRQRSDWVEAESLTSLQRSATGGSSSNAAGSSNNSSTGGGGSGASNSSGVAALGGVAVYPASADALLSWYTDRVYQLDDASGQIDVALDLASAGLERGVVGLARLHALLSDLASLLYHSEYEGDISLREYERLSLLERMQLLLSAAEPETLVQLVRLRALPFMAANGDTSRRLLHDYMVQLAHDGRMDCVRDLIAESLPTMPPAYRLLPSTALLMETALACVYACSRTDVLTEISDIFECLPSREMLQTAAAAADASAGPDDDPDVLEALQQQVDELENHLAACELLERFPGLAKPIGWFRTASGVGDAESDEAEAVRNQARDLVRSLAQAAIRADPPLSESAWRTLYAQLLALRTKRVLPFLSEDWISEQYVAALLGAARPVAFRLAAELLGGTPPPLPRATATAVVLRVSREFFNSAASVDDPALMHAEQCLDALAWADDEVSHELDLIAGVSLLSSFHVAVLPLEVRLHENKLRVVRQIVDQRDNRAHEQADTVLRLARLFGLASQQDQYQVRVLLAHCALQASAPSLAVDLVRPAILANYQPAWRVAADIADAAARAAADVHTSSRNDSAADEALADDAHADDAQADDARQRSVLAHAQQQMAGFALAHCPVSEFPGMFQRWQQQDTAACLAQLPGVKLDDPDALLAAADAVAVDHSISPAAQMRNCFWRASAAASRVYLYDGAGDTAGSSDAGLELQHELHVAAVLHAARLQGADTLARVLRQLVNSSSGDIDAAAAWLLGEDALGVRSAADVLTPPIWSGSSDQARRAMQLHAWHAASRALGLSTALAHSVEQLRPAMDALLAADDKQKRPLECTAWATAMETLEDLAENEQLQSLAIPMSGDVSLKDDAARQRVLRDLATTREPSALATARSLCRRYHIAFASVAARHIAFLIAAVPTTQHDQNASDAREDQGVGDAEAAERVQAVLPDVIDGVDAASWLVDTLRQDAWPRVTAAHASLPRVLLLLQTLASVCAHGAPDLAADAQAHADVAERLLALARDARASELFAASPLLRAAEPTDADDQRVRAELDAVLDEDNAGALARLAPSLPGVQISESDVLAGFVDRMLFGAMDSDHAQQRYPMLQRHFRRLEPDSLSRIAVHAAQRDSGLDRSLRARIVKDSSVLLKSKASPALRAERRHVKVLEALLGSDDDAIAATADAFDAARSFTDKLAVLQARAVAPEHPELLQRLVEIVMAAEAEAAAAWLAEQAEPDAAFVDAIYCAAVRDMLAPLSESAAPDALADAIALQLGDVLTHLTATGAQDSEWRVVATRVTDLVYRSACQELLRPAVRVALLRVLQKHRTGDEADDKRIADVLLVNQTEHLLQRGFAQSLAPGDLASDAARGSLIARLVLDAASDSVRLAVIAQILLLWQPKPQPPASQPEMSMCWRELVLAVTAVDAADVAVWRRLALPRAVWLVLAHAGDRMTVEDQEATADAAPPVMQPLLRLALPATRPERVLALAEETNAATASAASDAASDAGVNLVVSSHEHAHFHGPASPDSSFLAPESPLMSPSVRSSDTISTAVVAERAHDEQEDDVDEADAEVEADVLAQAQVALLLAVGSVACVVHRPGTVAQIVAALHADVPCLSLLHAVAQLAASRCSVHAAAVLAAAVHAPAALATPPAMLAMLRATLAASSVPQDDAAASDAGGVAKHGDGSGDGDDLGRRAQRLAMSWSAVSKLIERAQTELAS